MPGASGSGELPELGCGGGFSASECDDRRYRGNRGDEYPPRDQALALPCGVVPGFSQLSIRCPDHCILDNGYEGRAVPGAQP